MNKYLFDTSSLISFVRYYIPFDEDLMLRKFLLSGFNDNSFLLLNEVKMECKRVSSGLVFKEFQELGKIKSPKQKDFVFDAKWHDLIDNNFVLKGVRRKLNQEEYEQQKINFIKSADFALISYALSNKNIAIITEETINSNDSKIFKKIPAICNFKNIDCISLSQFLKKQIKIQYNILGSLF